MTLDDLDKYLSARPDIEWTADDDGNFYLRHKVFDGDKDKVKIEPKAWASLNESKLDQILTAGRNIDHITRVTGYFSRVSGWNKGKLGELADRNRVAVP